MGFDHLHPEGWMKPLHCLFVIGRLDELSRRVLFAGAVELMVSNRAAKRFKADFCEGRVRTEFRTCVLGGLAGVKFAAVIESDRGTTKVEYLVESRDLNEEVNRVMQDALESGREGRLESGAVRFTDEELREFRATPPTDAYVN